MTKDQILERLALLEAEQQKAIKNLEQLQANISAFQGAIEDCKYWLSVIDTPKTG